MMNGNSYGVYDGGYQNGFMNHGYMAGSHWVTSPFVLIGAVIVLIVGLIWLGLVIWALIDLAKHKPAHSVAWIFVIIFGHFMGPVGYYFIVARDRKMAHQHGVEHKHTTVQ